MCGIVGYISKHDNAFKSEREKFQIEGLVMDTLRGWDSTGIIWLGSEFEVNTMRAVQPGPQFVRNKKFIEADWQDGWACIGHNRAATHGSVKVKNAHPFRHGPIALVHNGTVSNWRSGMPKTNAKIEVDSSMIAYNLSLVGPDEANKVLKCIDGSFALVWVDKRDESINIVRNGSRPLHIAETNGSQLLYFMSEAGMLRSLSERQRNHGAKVKTIWELETHKLLKFKKGSLVPEVTSIDPFVRPAVNRLPSVSRKSSNRSYAQRNAEYEEMWGNAVRQTSSAAGGRDNLSVLHTDYKAWKGGRHVPLDDVMMDFIGDIYQLKANTRVSFTPCEYIAWGDNVGMVRGAFRHPFWGYTDWEGVVYDVPEKWATDERMNQEWTVTPIGAAPAWYGKSDTTMPPVMFQVRDFSWDGPNSDEEAEYYEKAEAELGKDLRKDYDDDIPFDCDAGECTEEERAEIMDDPTDWIGEELFYGPDDKLIWREQIQGLLEYGCASCTCNLTEDDHEDILWVGMHGDQPLCLDCQNTFTDPDYIPSEGEMH